MGRRSLATGLGHHRQKVLRGVQLYPPRPGVRHKNPSGEKEKQKSRNQRPQQRNRDVTARNQQCRDATRLSVIELVTKTRTVGFSPGQFTQLEGGGRGGQ